MSNYTGKVFRVFLQGVDRDDRFAVDFHSLAEMNRICPRYEADGYKVAKYRTLWMNNGTLEKPFEPVGPAGYPSRSAFVRA